MKVAWSPSGSGVDPCCCCPDVETVDVVFSDTDIYPSSCTGTGSGSFIATNNPLVGMFTLNQTFPGVFEWRLTISGGYTFNLFSDELCATPNGSGAGDVEIILDCSEDGLSITVTGATPLTTVTLFSHTGSPFFHFGEAAENQVLGATGNVVATA